MLFALDALLEATWRTMLATWPGLLEDGEVGERGHREHLAERIVQHCMDLQTEVERYVEEQPKHDEPDLDGALDW